ncbi:hypothetical protein PR003_g29231, partial [Phytophthora rubi]
MSERSDGGSIEDTTEDWIASAVQGTPQRQLAGEVRLLPGERMGWWSVQKLDKRVRMRTLVNGAVNDSRIRILLDTGANVSVISEKYAKRLRLRDIPGHGRCIEVQGITKGKTATTRRASVKVTLGWERIYVFDVWIMDHNAGVDVVLGTDFMIPAGIRLYLFNATAKLPDEVMIPLIKTLNMIDEAEGSHVPSGPTEVLQIPGREWKEFRLPRRNPPWDTHVLWVRRTETFIPTVTRFKRGTPDRVRLTNIINRLASCPIHLPIVVWVPTGSLPKTEGYVQLDSAKYTEWQVLAYAAVRDKTLFEWEAQLYEEWLATQPPAVERRQYPTPTGVLCHPDDDSKEACD